MFKRYTYWNLASVIRVALVGILFGVIYMLLINTVYNSVKLLLTPLGIGPLVDTVLSGLWYMAGPIAIYLVPTIGSAVVGETIASMVEMFLGGQWGALTIMEGLIQGAGNELGFFPKKSRYERCSWGSVLLGSFGAHLGGFIPSYFIYGWNHFSVSLQIAMFITGALSSLVFDGVLVKLIMNLLDRALSPEVR
ncbi:MAG TPA: ECF transporter S component [Candidatus Limosilactobacillus excrementigallinarum]|nr:ECF transporter S component [Candidatus Limosilactobacillus excrementigallinarum]